MSRWDALKPEEDDSHRNRQHHHPNNRNHHYSLTKPKVKNFNNQETMSHNRNHLAKKRETVTQQPFVIDNSSSSTTSKNNDTASRVLRQYEELQQQIMQTRKQDDDDNEENLNVDLDRMVSQLANLISSPQGLEVLSAETVALETVFEIFLPYLLESRPPKAVLLQDDDDSNSSITDQTSSFTNDAQSLTVAIPRRIDGSASLSAYASSLCCVGSCLCILLNDSRYASAMMAPLVKDDVVSVVSMSSSSNGNALEEKEKKEDVVLLTETVNPIRSRMFEVLQQKLLETLNVATDTTASSSTSSSSATAITAKMTMPRVLVCLCQTLSTALHLSLTMDYGTTAVPTTNRKIGDVDVAAIKSFLSQVVMLSSEHRITTQEDDENDDNDACTLLLSAALDLFRAVLKQRHPDCSSSFASLLLLENYTVTSSSRKTTKVTNPGSHHPQPPCCGCMQQQGVSTSSSGCCNSFLNLIHKFNLDAIGCAVDLLDNLPLETWLCNTRASGNNTTKTTTTTTPSFVFLRSTLSFPQRIVSGLENLIRTTECLLLRITTSRRREGIGSSRSSVAESSSVLALVTSLLVRIPYVHAPALQPWAVRLVGTLANAILAVNTTPNTSSSSMNTTTTRRRFVDFDQHRSQTTTSSSSSSSAASTTTAIMIDSFLAAVGGRVTPLGETTSMSIPMCLWLDSEEGKMFLMTLLGRLSGHHDHQQGGSSSSSRSSSDVMIPSLGQVVRSILRSYPKLVCSDPVLWKAFVSCFESLTSQGSSSDSVKQGVELLEGILEGRSRSALVEGKEEEEVGRFLQLTSSFQDTMLRILLLDGPAAAGCKAVACSSYSVLLPQDWDDLETSTSGGCLVHVRPILQLCIRGSAGLRAESLKAVGNICSNYYSATRVMSLSEDREQETFCDEVCSTMVQGCNDQSPKARCMALFALGNLCHALGQHPTLSSLVHDQALERAAACLRSCMDDSDDKVKGNATRSVGHVASLVLQRNTDVEKQGGFDSTDFFRQLLQSLAMQLQGTLLLLCVDQVRTLTWKERQALKKQGWGACNTLARLFESGIVRHDDLSEGIVEVLHGLVACVTRLSELSEKVAGSACTSLRAAFSSHDCSASILLLMGKHDAFIGRCLWSCTSFLFLGRCGQSRDEAVTLSKDSKLRNEVELLLSVLLENVSVSDANLFLERSNTLLNHSSMLSWLYDWMDHHSSTAHAYSAFALAMSNRVIHVDADLEIRFSNRATMFITDQGEADEEL